MSLADEHHRAWMLETLDAAAKRFGLVMSTGPVFGWRDRSVGARVRGAGGDQWLRVVTEHVHWASGDFWTGNTDASTVAGIAKPRVLDVDEWDDGPQRVRAEVMTVVPGEVCSPVPQLTSEVNLPGSWWAELRRSMDKIEHVATDRNQSAKTTCRRLRVFFGEQVDPKITRWVPAHRDPHWANVLRPDFALLDWELWGIAPFGYDAATLYCYSLLAPATAAKVYETFADVLDIPDGRRSQLYVIARLLQRAERGEHPDLVIPLHRHARTLLSLLSSW